MSFSIEHSYHPANTLNFQLDGEFKGINVSDFEHDVLNEIKLNKAKLIIFDIRKVTYVDSAAIEFIFLCNKICQEAGQSLTLANPAANIKKLFQILRLDKVIQVI